MSGPHLHILLAHVPVIGVVFGIMVLVYAWAFRRTESAHVAMAIFAVSGLAALAVYLTGELAEEAIEHLPGISEALIERHEDVAEYAFIGTLVLGLSSLVGMLFTLKREVPRWLSGSLLVMAVVVAIILAYTANLGGQINHPEIRSEVVVKQSTEYLSELLTRTSTVGVIVHDRPEGLCFNRGKSL